MHEVSDMVTVMPGAVPAVIAALADADEYVRRTAAFFGRDRTGGGRSGAGAKRRSH